MVAYEELDTFVGKFVDELFCALSKTSDDSTNNRR